MFLKVSSGTSQMTCFPRRDSSEASVKETYLFHSRDGSIFPVQQSGVNLLTSFSIKFSICDFSGPGAGKPCVFPFRFEEVTAYGCIVYYEGEKV